MGHILNTGIRCFRAIRVEINTAAQQRQFAKLRHLYFPGEHFLIIMMGYDTKAFTWSSTAVKIAT